MASAGTTWLGFSVVDGADSEDSDETEETLPASVELPEPSSVSVSGSEVEDDEELTPSVTKSPSSGLAEELEAEEVVSNETAGASVPSLLLSNGVVFTSSGMVGGAAVAALDEPISSVFSSAAVGVDGPSSGAAAAEPSVPDVVVEPSAADAADDEPS